MADLKTSILDALYQEYGKCVALAERTSHNTRISYRNKADGILIAIKTIEGFTAEPDNSAYCGRGPCCLRSGHVGKCRT